MPLWSNRRYDADELGAASLERAVDPEELLLSLEPECVERVEHRRIEYVLAGCRHRLLELDKRTVDSACKILQPGRIDGGIEIGKDRNLPSRNHPPPREFLERAGGIGAECVAKREQRIVDLLPSCVPDDAQQ